MIKPTDYIPKRKRSFGSTYTTRPSRPATSETRSLKEIQFFLDGDEQIATSQV